jgi:hypothetical protein
MSYNPLNPNGQATMANSEPVVIASNQSAVSVAGTINIGNTTANPVPVQPPASGSLPVLVVGSVLTAPVANQSVSGTVGVSVIGRPGVILYDTAGADLDFRQENENWNAADHGVLVFGRDMESTPNKYRALTTNTEGDLAVDLSDINGSEPDVGNGLSSIGTLRVTIASDSSGKIATITSIVGTPSISGTVNVGNLPTTQNISGSVAAWLQSSNASVITVGSPVANQSVSGTVNVGNFPTNQNVSGSVIAFPVGNQSVSGTVVATQLAGSVLAVSGSFAPAANQSVSGTVGASVIGHAPVVIVGGSIAASMTPPANQSVSGTVQVDVRGSVATVIIGGSVATGNSSVQVLNFPANQSVSGNVGISGNVTVVSSIAGGIFPISGSVGAVITNTNINVGGSVVAFQGSGWSGSVAAIQSGTRITSVVNSTPSSLLVGASIIGLTPVTVSNTTLNVSGSVAAWLQSTNASVITVGTAAANQSVSGTVGASVLGVVNASVVGTVKVFPASVVSGTGSVNGAASVQILSAPGATLRNYVTDIMISNTGTATSLVKITDGDGSIIGKTIAPAGGGSNIIGLSTPLVPSLNKVINISADTASSVIHAWIGGYVAP